MDQALGDVTSVLRAIREEDESASARLLPLVYEELRLLARRQMAGERPGHTLQATALVHEAYLRLTGGEPLQWADRAHFFRAAARAMRRILIDRARQRGTARAGGGFQRATAVDVAADGPPLEETLALDQALDALERLDPRMAEVVHLRYFAGLSAEETARALDVTVRTVTREWTAARAWLYRALGGATDGAGGSGS